MGENKRMKYIQHSNKDCWCGGHNHKNVKKNKNHNSTKRKLSIKNIRRWLRKVYDKNI